MSLELVLVKQSTNILYTDFIMDSSEERSTECDKEWGKRMDEQSETMGKKQTVISEFLIHGNRVSNDNDSGE